jgi:hypothetical protein
VESGTIEQALPGLERKVSRGLDSAAASVIGFSPQKRLTLVAGSSNPGLAGRIADQLGCELGGVTV